MEKRTLFALALAFIILLLYQYLLPQPQQVQKKATVEKKEVPKELEPVMPAEISIPKGISSEEKEIRVETELYSAVFTTKGGTIKYYEIKSFKDKEGKNVVLLKNPGLKA